MSATSPMSQSSAPSAWSARGGVTLDRDLPVLSALAAEPSLSQRQLAQRLDLPLATAHFVLRRLIEKGLVKAHNAASSKRKLGYLYVLTRHGLQAKARLTYAFLHRAAAQHRDLVNTVGSALDDAAMRERNGARRVPVALVGAGPLGEVVRDVIRARPGLVLVKSVARARIAVVVDPAVPRPTKEGLRLLELG